MISQGKFYRQWIAANAWAEAAGLGTTFVIGRGLATWFEQSQGVLFVIVNALLAVLLGIFLEGVLIGVAQERVLRRRLLELRRLSWVKATAAGAGLAWLLGMVPSTVMSLMPDDSTGQEAVEPSAYVQYGMAVILGLVAGPILGLVQWTVLRRYVKHASRWLWANALAWAIGMPLIFLGMDFVPWNSHWIVVTFSIYVVCGVAGLVVGAVHGRCLVMLLDDAARDSASEQADKPKKRTRLWLNFSLRTFLLAVTVLCVWLGFIVNRANNQKRAVAWVREQRGLVYYDFEVDLETVPVEDAEPPGPEFLRNWIGIDFFADVVYIDLSEAGRTLDTDATPPPIDDVAPLAVLTKIRSLSLGPTADLSPLAAMTEIQDLYLHGEQVTDLSPLSGMTKMKTLYLYETLVSDLSPLTRMTRMEFLMLDGTQVSELSPLAGMREMRYLRLADTHVADLSPLADMKKIQELILSDTHVAELSPLANMSGLEYLDLRGTQVAELSPLANLSGLVYLDLGGTQVSDLSPLAELPALEELDLSGTQVSDLSPLAKLTGMKTLYFSSTAVCDLTPLARMTKMERLSLANTQGADLSPLAGMTRLQFLNLQGKSEWDLTPLVKMQGIQIWLYKNQQATIPAEFPSRVRRFGVPHQN